MGLKSCSTLIGGLTLAVIKVNVLMALILDL